MKGIAWLAVLSIGLSSAAFAEGLGRWTTGSPMPSARSEVAVAAVAGKVYVVGGFGGVRELEIYDPATDRWSQGAPVPRALHHVAALDTGDKLYVIGGYADGWNPTDSVYEYDPKLDLWRLLAPLPTARGALAAVALDGKIHAIGGTGSGRRNTPAHEPDMAWAWARSARHRPPSPGGLRPARRRPGRGRVPGSCAGPRRPAPSARAAFEPRIRTSFAPSSIRSIKSRR